MNFTGGTKQ